MNLDGFALPIKKLKGTDPVGSLDLSSKRLGPASGVVIGALIRGNASLTKVRAAALPSALALHASERVLPPVQLNIKYNELGNEGEAAIRESVRGKEGFELEINTN